MQWRIDMVISTLAAVALFGFGGSTIDIVKGTNIVETPFRYVCHKAGGDWINLHQPHAACVGGTWKRPEDATGE